MKELLKKFPRLKDWYDIGPVQKAELEEFMCAFLNSATGITANSKLVRAGDPVWVFSSTGKPTKTTVKQLEWVTNYELFGPVPVRHSFSTEQAARQYQKHNAVQQVPMGSS